MRIHPLIDWPQEDVEEYIAEHDLPVHPLSGQGYPSVGCAPCTQPVKREKDGTRAGRWVGKEKTECGLQVEFSDR